MAGGSVHFINDSIAMLPRPVHDPRRRHRVAGLGWRRLRIGRRCNSNRHTSSTYAAAANPTGAAANGEIEDYVASITRPGIGEAIRTTKIACKAGGGPTLDIL